MEKRTKTNWGMIRTSMKLVMISDVVVAQSRDYAKLENELDDILLDLF